jgi:hypothetical protein
MEDEQIRDGRVHIVITPTPERSAKRIDGEKDVLIVEGDRGGIQMQSFSFPLDFYLRKQFISRRQWLAGNRLHKLWASGCVEGYVQFQYRESNGGEPKLQFIPPGAFAIEYREAMRAVEGSERRRIAFHVCCDCQFLKTSKQFSSQRTAQRLGMPLLIDALDDLAKHFERR